VYLFGNVVVTTDDAVICGSVLLLLAALFLLLQVTPLGKVIQATFQSQQARRWWASTSRCSTH
jgi:branched-subunit amino acid ABC-type transport system permease component